MALTAKQQKFVQEYLIDLNATQAAIRAGYSPSTAKEIGAQNLTKLNLKNAIDKALAERAKRTGVNADRVIRELAKIAFVKLTDVANMDEATIRDGADENDLASICSIKVKKIPTEFGTITEREIKTADKLKALELLGKHLNMFKDSSVNVSVGVQIVDDIK
jgi:phage terminase small subunit